MDRGGGSSTSPEGGRGGAAAPEGEMGEAVPSALASSRFCLSAPPPLHTCSCLITSRFCLSAAASITSLTSVSNLTPLVRTKATWFWSPSGRGPQHPDKTPSEMPGQGGEVVYICVCGGGGRAPKGPHSVQEAWPSMPLSEVLS